jgi:phosphoglycolate phosphatase-like HAD superfamily hydrolase
MENAVAELVRFLEMFREHGPLPILWVGAGASAAAGYPTLWQLEELLRKLLPGSTKTGFELIDALVEECGKALLANELETHLGKPRKFAELHRALARLAGAGLFSAIFTTNYDELIEDALKAEDIHYVPQALEHNYVLQRRKNLLVRRRPERRELCVLSSLVSAPLQPARPEPAHVPAGLRRLLDDRPAPARLAQRPA